MGKMQSLFSRILVGVYHISLQILHERHCYKGIKFLRNELNSFKMDVFVKNINIQIVLVFELGIVIKLLFFFQVMIGYIQIDQLNSLEQQIEAFFRRCNFY